MLESAETEERLLSLLPVFIQHSLIPTLPWPSAGQCCGLGSQAHSPRSSSPMTVQRVNDSSYRIPRTPPAGIGSAFAEDHVSGPLWKRHTGQAEQESARSPGNGDYVVHGTKGTSVLDKFKPKPLRVTSGPFI